MYKKFTWKERIEILLLGDFIFTADSVVEEKPQPEPEIGIFSIETLMSQIKMRDGEIEQLKNENFQQERRLGKFAEAKLMLADIYNEYTRYLITKDRVHGYEQALESTFLPKLIDKAGIFTGQKKSPPPAKED